MERSSFRHLRFHKRKEDGIRILSPKAVNRYVPGPPVSGNSYEEVFVLVMVQPLSESAEVDVN